MRAGLVGVPVNRKLAADTVEYVLRDSGAKLAFVDNERALLVPRDIPQVSFDDTAGFTALCEPGDFDSIAPAVTKSRCFCTHPAQPANRRVFHSRISDTDGLSINACRLALTTRPNDLVAAPLYHMNALAIAKFAAFAGARTCCCRSSPPRPISQP